MTMKPLRILVVDDEEDLCEILQFNLEGEGYQVDTANSAEEALEKDVSKYHLFLLDVMMGGMSGFKLADKLRKDQQTAHIPMIFITAKDTENDLLTGFNIGADDYISKPFSIREVTVRVKAVLRRTLGREVEESDILKYENLTMDLAKKAVYLDQKSIALTKKEFEMLHLLVSHPGRVFSREDILKRVWTDDVYVLDRTIDVNITRLRKKLDSFGQYIVTRLGYGYCFDTH